MGTVAILAQAILAQVVLGLRILPPLNHHFPRLFDLTSSRGVKSAVVMSSNKFTKAQEDAKRYVDSHDLEHFITQMLNRTVQQRPENPKVFMLEFMANQIGEAILKEHGIQ